jgi:hypothetical protein
MTDPNNQNPDGQGGAGGSSGGDSGKPDTDLVEKLVQERIAEHLKPIKEKLDSAFTQRDEALQRAAALEKEKRDAEVARLKEEGKLSEAYERQLAEERAEKEVLQKQNIQLSRDTEVRSALTGLDFRNEKAVEMAFQEITNQLVRNEQGKWVHRSGVSVRDFIKVFSESEDNSFLFKPKVSSGSGSAGPSGGAPSGSPKSLFGLPQSEVIKLAAEGKLPNQQRKT